MGRFVGKENRRRGFRIVLWTVGLFILAQVLGGLVFDYLWIRVSFPWQPNRYGTLQARAGRRKSSFWAAHALAACGIAISWMPACGRSWESSRRVRSIAPCRMAIPLSANAY